MSIELNIINKYHNHITYLSSKLFSEVYITIQVIMIKTM